MPSKIAIAFIIISIVFHNVIIQCNGNPWGRKQNIGGRSAAPSPRPGNIVDSFLNHEPLTTPNKKRTPAQVQAFKTKWMEIFKAKGTVDGTFDFTGESCANGYGNLYKKLKSTNTVIYEACFNDDAVITIYTKHRIPSPKELEKVVQVARKDVDTTWRHSYFLSLWDIEFYYRTKTQKQQFDKILGSNQKYLSDVLSQSYYQAHGHLAPNADWKDRYGQFATFEDHNCVPEMQSVNNGHWKKLENYGRALSDELNSEILAITGAHEQLELKSEKTGKMIKVFLDNDHNRVPIPKMLWKLYIDERTNNSVAFITSNDPHMTKNAAETSNKMCDSKCAEIGFAFNPDIIKSGVTVCCTYRELAKIINYALPINIPIGSSLLICQDELRKYKNRPGSKSPRRSPGK